MTLSAISDVDVLKSRLNRLVNPWIKRSNAREKQKLKSGKSLKSEVPKTLILYPADSEERQKLPLPLRRLTNTIGNDLNIPLEIGFVPVSTYELSTIERVARSLRWAIDGAQILKYPPRVDIPVKYQNELLQQEDWILPDTSPGIAKVLYNPDARQDRKHMERFRVIHGNVARLGAKAQQDLQRLGQYENQLSIAREQLNQLRVCPLCHKMARVEDFHVSEGDIFTCECRESSCQVTWGTRKCSSCQQAYPFLDFQKMDQPLDVSNPDWVDRYFGMDILAMPCPSTLHAFICPFCGSCGDRHAGDSATCQECSKVREFSVLDVDR
jgi:hypothetical protein